MAKRKIVQWYEVDRTVRGLDTDIEHEICVQREAIPLVFLPGIMGSRLRLTGTDENQKTGGTPNLRWNPSGGWLLTKYAPKDGTERKQFIVGPGRFDGAYLEPTNTTPPGDGFAALMSDYVDDFLNSLKSHDWGVLNKIFEFPVYAFGYNWTDNAEEAGKKLATKIDDIIAEAKRVVGACEQVILITHSMGGLVARAASYLAHASGSILGIIHVVQPAMGTPAAYWRMKAGFEGNFLVSWALGNSAETVAPVLGNIPGGLELLPNKLHRTNHHSPRWLTITENGRVTKSLPQNGDPYEEIYRVPAVVKPKAGEKPSTNTYWGLIDPDLLGPAPIPPKGSMDQRARAKSARNPWQNFLDVLQIAETFHDNLQKNQHPNTFCARGVGHKTADVVELRIESNWVRTDPYPTRCFRGFFNAADGSSMQAVLQDPAGDGDGTVARSSAASLDKPGKQRPGDRAYEVEHQPAFKDAGIQHFAIQGIIALCRKRYELYRHSIGNYPAP